MLSSALSTDHGTKSTSIDPKCNINTGIAATASCPELQSPSHDVCISIQTMATGI
jgi:hypothetical protein